MNLATMEESHHSADLAVYNSTEPSVVWSHIDNSLSGYGCGFGYGWTNAKMAYLQDEEGKAAIVSGGRQQMARRCKLLMSCPLAGERSSLALREPERISNLEA